MTTITNNNKNCEIYMYNKNTGLLNSELKLMNELKNIFKIRTIRFMVVFIMGTKMIV